MNDDPVAAALAGGQVGDDDDPDIYSYKRGQTVDWPFKSTINSVAGEPRDGGSRKHTGVDFSGKRGSPVPHAPKRDGIVTDVGSNRKAGNYVRVDDGVWEYTYGHLDKVDVAKDGRVSKGQQIGLLGQTGNATGPHVHIARRPSKLGREGVKSRLSALTGGSSDPVAAALAGTPPASSEPFKSDPGRLAGMLEMAGDVANRHESLGKNKYETPLGTEYTATDGLADQAHQVGFRVPRQQARRVVRRVAAPVVSKEARAIGQAGSSLAKAGAPIANALSGVVGQIAPFVNSVTGETPRATIPNAARRNRDFVTGSMGRAPGEPATDTVLASQMARGHDPRVLAPRIEPSSYLAPSHSTSVKTGSSYKDQFAHRTRSGAAPVTTIQRQNRDFDNWANRPGVEPGVSVRKGLDALAPPTFQELRKRHQGQVVDGYYEGDKVDPLAIPSGAITADGAPVPKYKSVQEYFAKNPEKAPKGWFGLPKDSLTLLEALMSDDPVGAFSRVGGLELDETTRAAIGPQQEANFRASKVGKFQREASLSALDVLLAPGLPTSGLGRRAFEKSEYLRAYGKTPEGQAWLKSLGALENPVRGLINGMGRALGGLTLDNLYNYEESLKANPNAALPESTEFIGEAAGMAGKAVPQLAALALSGGAATGLGLTGAGATSFAGAVGLGGSELISGQHPESPYPETLRERGARGLHAAALGGFMGPVAAGTAPFLDPLVARGEQAIAGVAGRQGGSMLNRAGQKVAAVVEKLAVPSRLKSGVDMFASTYPAALATGQPVPSVGEGILNAGMAVLTGPEWNRFHTSKAIKARAADVEAGRAPKPPAPGDVVELGRAGGDAPVYGQIEHISPNGAVTVRLEDGKQRFLSPKSQETTGLRVLDPQAPADRAIINQSFALTADEGPAGGVVPIAADPVAKALEPTLGPENGARIDALKAELADVRSQIEAAGGSDKAPIALIDKALDLRNELLELEGAAPMVPGERTLGRSSAPDVAEPDPVARTLAQNEGAQAPAPRVTETRVAPVEISDVGRVGTEAVAGQLERHIDALKQTLAAEKNPTIRKAIETEIATATARLEIARVDKQIAELEARIKATGGKKSPLHLRKNLERLQIKRETLVTAAGLEPAAHPSGIGITSELNAETPAAVPGPGNRQDIVRRPTDEEWASWNDDQKRAHTEQVHQAYRVDKKTGAGNDVSFAEAVDHVRSTGAEPTVSVVDINALKAIQDAFGGHKFGDAIIQAAVDALHEAGLIPHRIGGDEFAIVGTADPATQQAQIDRALEGLRRKELRGRTKDGRDFTVSNLSWSHGTEKAEPGSVIVERGQKAEGVKDVLEGADAKLYEHKTSLEGTDRAARNPDGSPASRDAIPPALNVRVHGDAEAGGNRPGLGGDQGPDGQHLAAKKGAPAAPEPPRKPTFDELDEASSQAPKKGSVEVEVAGRKYMVNAKGEVFSDTGRLVYHPDAGVVDGLLPHSDAEKGGETADRPETSRADGTKYAETVEQAASGAKFDPLLHVRQPEHTPQGLRLNAEAAGLVNHLLGGDHDKVGWYAFTVPLVQVPEMRGRLADLIEGGTLDAAGERAARELDDILAAIERNDDDALSFVVFNLDDLVAEARKTGDFSEIEKIIGEEIAHGWQFEDVFNKSGRLDGVDWLPPDVAAKMPFRERIRKFLLDIGYGGEARAVNDRTLLLEATAQFVVGQDIGLRTREELEEFNNWLRDGIEAEHGAGALARYENIPVDLSPFMRDYTERGKPEAREPDDLAPGFAGETPEKTLGRGETDEGPTDQASKPGVRETVHESRRRPDEPSTQDGEGKSGGKGDSRRDLGRYAGEPGKTLGRSRQADDAEPVEGPHTLARSDVDVPAPVEEGTGPRTLGPSSAPDEGPLGLAAVRSPERRGAAKGDTDEHIYFEIAPSKSTKYADAWHKQSQEARAASSRRIADATLPKILDAIGLGDRNLEIQHTVGGFLLETNPSTRVSGSLTRLQARKIAAAIGYTYRQDSVLVARLDSKIGTTDYMVVTFDKGELTTEQADRFFQHLGTVHKGLGGGYAVKDDSMLLLNVRGDEGPYSGLDRAEFDRLVMQAAESYDPEVALLVEPGDTLADVVMADNDWEVDTNGEGYARSTNQIGRPAVARALGRIREQVDAFHDQIAKGGKVREDREEDSAGASSEAVALPALRRKERARASQELDEAIERRPGRSRAELVKTPEFKAWFGKSKLVNPATGRPLVRYHATLGDFDVFKRSSNDVGFHIGSAAQANDRLVIQANIAGGVHDGANVMPVYASIENPFSMHHDPMEWTGDSLYDAVEMSMDDMTQLEKWLDGRRLTGPLFRRFLQAQGYDGIVYENRNEYDTQAGAELRRAAIDARRALRAGYKRLRYNTGDPEPQELKDLRQAVKDAEQAETEYAQTQPYGDSWVAFEKTQIKSALGNKGTFSKKNPNILAAVRRPERERRSHGQHLESEGELAAQAALKKLKGGVVDSAKFRDEFLKAGGSKGDFYELGLEDLIRRAGAKVDEYDIDRTLLANRVIVTVKDLSRLGGVDSDIIASYMGEFVELETQYHPLVAQLEEEVKRSGQFGDPTDRDHHVQGVIEDLQANGEESLFWEKYNAARYIVDWHEQMEDLQSRGTGDTGLENWWDTDLELGEDAPQRYEQYSHPGGTGYRELSFQLPEEFWQGTPYEDPHFSQKGAFAHARVKFRTVGGKTYLEVVEIQSDLHQAGRSEGYKVSRFAKDRLARAAKTMNEAHMAARQELRVIEGTIESWVEGNTATKDEALGLQQYVKKAMEDWRTLDPGPHVPKRLTELRQWKNFERLRQEHIAATAAYKEMVRGARVDPKRRPTIESVEDVPFKTTWYQYVLKELLQDAIENGAEGLLVNTGDEIAKRFSVDKFLDYIKYSSETKVSYEDVEVHKDYAGQYRVTGVVKGAGGRVTLKTVDDEDEAEEFAQQARDGATFWRLQYKLKDREPFTLNYTTTSAVYKTFGKQIADRMVAGEGRQEKTMRVLEGEGLVARNEGMRQFYDKNVPDFLNKYARRMGWNTKVEKTTVLTTEADPTVAVVEVDDLMNEQAATTVWEVRSASHGPQYTPYTVSVWATKERAEQEAESHRRGNPVEMHSFPIPEEMAIDITRKGQTYSLAAVRRKEPPKPQELEPAPIRHPYSMAIDLALQRVLAPDTKAISVQSLEKQLLRYGATKADLIATGVTDLVEETKESGAKRVDRAKLEEVVAANLAKWTPVARLTGPARDEEEDFDGDYWGIEDDDEFDELQSANQYQQWSTPNENRFYREELLELLGHSGDLRNASGQRYNNPHFDDSHAFSHNRAQDRVWNGEEWLEVLEIQSDLHQDARKEGYTERPTSRKAREAFEARRKAQSAYMRAIAEGVQGDERDRLRIAANEALNVEMKLFATEGQPWSPYQKTWWQLHLKRLIQEAIDNNQKGLLINSGETQRRRFGLDEHLSRVDVTIKETFEHPKNQGVIYKLEIWRPNHGAHQTVLVDDRTTSSERLDRYVGEDVAERIRRQMQGGKVGDKLVLNKRDLAASEGKHGHFYDVMIPSFLEKYAKRLGFKIRVRPVTIRTIAPAPKGYFRAVRDDRKYYDGVDRWNVFVGGNEVPKAFYYSKEEADAYIARQEAGKPELMWKFEIPDGMREQLRETGQVIGLAALRRPLDRSVIGALNQKGETAEKSVKQRRATERVSLERLIPQLAKVGAKLLVAPEVTTREHWNAGMEKRFGAQFKRVATQVYNEALEIFGAEARAAKVSKSRARGLALRKAAGGALEPNRLELFKKALEVERTRGDEASLASIASHLEAFIVGMSGRLEPLDAPNAPQNAAAREKRVARAAAGMEMELARIVEEIQAERHTKGSAGLDWYRAAIRRTVRVMTELYPTLADPDHALLFKILLGPTSPNEKPFSNLYKAAKLYEGWLASAKSDEERVFPLRRANGKRWGFVGLYGALHRLEGLIAMYGFSGALKWLKKKHPLGRPGSTDPNTLRYWKPGLAPADLHGRDEAPGLFIFGPKAGPFASNILGLDYLTVDLWATRTYNALMGTLVGWDTVDKQLAADLTKAGTWGEENVDWRWHPTEPGRKQRWAPIEQPRNEGERQIIIDAFVRATQSIARRFNVKLKVPDAQALLWFAEQLLYREHGAKNESWTFDQAALEYVRQHGILANARGIQPRHTAAGSRVSGVAAEVRVPRPRTIRRAEATPAGTAPGSATAAAEKANSVVVRLPAPGVTGVLRLNPPAAALAHQLFGWGPASEIDWTGKVVDIGLLADMLPRLRSMATAENVSANARQRAAALLKNMTDIVVAGGTGEKRAAVSVELRNLDGLSKANAEKTLKELELRGIIFEEVYKLHESRKDGSILKETKKARLPHQKEVLERLEDEGYRYTTENAMLVEIIPRVFANNETFGLEGKALIDLRAALGRIVKENIGDATAKRFRRGVTPDLKTLSGAYPRPGRKPIELAPELAPEEDAESDQERAGRAQAAKGGALAAVRRAPRPFYYGGAEKAREILSKQKGDTVNPDAFLKAAAAKQIPKGDLVELGLAKLLVPGGRSIPKDYLEALIAANEMEVEVTTLAPASKEKVEQLGVLRKRARTLIQENKPLWDEAFKLVPPGDNVDLVATHQSGRTKKASLYSERSIQDWIANTLDNHPQVQFSGDGATPELQKWIENVREYQATNRALDELERDVMHREQPQYGKYAPTDKVDYFEMLFRLPVRTLSDFPSRYSLLTPEEREEIDALQTSMRKAGLTMTEYDALQRRWADIVETAKADESEHSSKLTQQAMYTATHWRHLAARTFAHARASIRELNGKRYLHVHEMQSDLLQRWKKYGIKGQPPPAPEPLTEFPKGEGQFVIEPIERGEESRKELDENGIEKSSVQQELLRRTRKHYGIAKNFADAEEYLRGQGMIRPSELPGWRAASKWMNAYENSASRSARWIGEPAPRSEFIEPLPPFPHEFVRAVRDYLPDLLPSWVDDESRFRLMAKVPTKTGHKLVALGSAPTEEELRGPLGVEQINTYLAALHKGAVDNNEKYGVPDVPFKTTWHEFIVKRMIQVALDAGLDGLILDNGETNSDRFSLDREIKSLTWSPRPGSTKGRLYAEHKTDGSTVFDQTIEEADLPDYVGAELAPKLVEAGTLSGSNLRVPGKGQKEFYDQKVVNFLNKYSRRHQWGANVEETRLRPGALALFTIVEFKLDDGGTSYRAYDQNGRISENFWFDANEALEWVDERKGTITDHTIEVNKDPDDDEYTWIRVVNGRTSKTISTHPFVSGLKGLNRVRALERKIGEVVLGMRAHAPAPDDAPLDKVSPLDKGWKFEFTDKLKEDVLEKGQDLSLAAMRRPNPSKPDYERAEPARVNAKNWYHGTGKAGLKASSIDPLQTNIESIFGFGFYTTDTRAVATSYAEKKGAKSGTPRVYKLQVDVSNVLDLELPAPPAVRSLFKTYADKVLDPVGLGEELEETLANRNATTEELYYSYKHELSDYSHEYQVSRDEISEFVADFLTDLRDLGFDAVMHTGGWRTKSEAPHEVLILLDPNEVITSIGRPNRVTAMDEEEVAPRTRTEVRKVPGQAPIAGAGGEPRRPRGQELEDDAITGILEEGDYGLAAKRRPKLAKDDEMTRIEKAQREARNPGMLRRFKKWAAEQPERARNIVTYTQNMFARVDKLVHQVQERNGILLPSQNPTVRNALYYGGGAGVVEAMFRDFLDIQRDAIKQGLDHALSRLLNLHAYDRAYKTKREHMATIIEDFAQDAVDQLPTLVFRTLRDNGHLSPQNFAEVQRIHAAGAGAPSVRLKLGLWRVSRRNWERANIAGAVVGLRPGKTVVWDKRWMKDHRELGHIRRDIKFHRIVPEQLSESAIQLKINNLISSLDPDQVTQLNALADRHYALNRTILDTAYDAGIISAKAYATMTKRGDRYVPLSRIMDAIDEGTPYKPTPDGLDLSVQKILFRLKGSERYNIDPIIASMARAQETIREASANLAALTFIELRNHDPMLAGIIHVRAEGEKLEPGMGELSVFDNGRKQKWVVPEAVAREMHLATAAQARVMGEAFIGFVNHVFKAGATGANLAFALPNVARDLRDWVAFAEHAPRLYKPHELAKATGQYLASMYHVLRKDQVYREWLRSGAAYSTRQKFFTPEDFLKTFWGDLVARPWKAPLLPLHAVTHVVSALEETTKVTAFRRAKKGFLKEGFAPDEAQIAAAYESRTYGGSHDFAIGGSYAPQMNLVMPFIRARMGGTRRAVRTFSGADLYLPGARGGLGGIGGNPNAKRKGWARLLGRPGVAPVRQLQAQRVGTALFRLFSKMATATVLGGLYYQYGIKPYEEDYKKIPPSERDSNWVIFTNDFEELPNGEMKRIGYKIPMSHVDQMFFPAIVSMYRHFGTGAPEDSFENVVANELLQFSPVGINRSEGEVVPRALFRAMVSNMTPLLRSPAEQGMNWDTFRDMSIESAWMQEVDPVKRFVAGRTSPAYIRTAEYADYLIRKFSNGKSDYLINNPIRLQKLVEDVTGGASKMGTDLIDAAIEDAPLANMDRKAKIPILGALQRRFIVSSTNDVLNQQNERFYKNLEVAGESIRSFRRDGEQLGAAEAARYLEDPINFRAAAFSEELAQIARGQAILRQGYNAIAKHETMSIPEKRAAMKELVAEEKRLLERAEEIDKIMKGKRPDSLVSDETAATFRYNIEVELEKFRILERFRTTSDFKGVSQLEQEALKDRIRQRVDSMRLDPYQERKPAAPEGIVKPGDIRDFTQKQKDRVEAFARLQAGQVKVDDRWVPIDRWLAEGAP